jgi:hypothetical protein
MNTTQSIESVEMVDKLMTCFRNGSTPSNDDIAKAYELDIDVKYLKNYIEEVENAEPIEEY